MPSLAKLGLYVALQSAGILHFSFDPNLSVNQSLTKISTTPAGTRPGWITDYQDKIYSISRTSYPDVNTKSGGVFGFRENSASLVPINDVTSNGEGGVHCDVSPDGKTLAVANIDGSTAAIYPLGSNGYIGNASQKFDYHLTGNASATARPHQSIFDPTGQFLFIPLLDNDVVAVYSTRNAGKVRNVQNITLLSDSGPRHAIFRTVSSRKAVMYLIGEYDNTVRTYSLDYNGAPGSATNLTINELSIISTLGTPGRTPKGSGQSAAEVAITNDGKFVYASNRNTAVLEKNTLAIYSVNNDYTLTYLGFNLTLGTTPRHFALSNDAKSQWLAVGNQVTQDIVVFERDVNRGFMKRVKGTFDLGELDTTARQGPSCLLWK